MANKISIPSVVSLNTEGMPFGTVVFLQAVEDGLKVVDNNVVYKDAITIVVPSPTIRAKSAQGQTFSISGTNVASGDDYAVLIADFNSLLQSHLQLRQTVDDLVKQIQGR